MLFRSTLNNNVFLPTLTQGFLYTGSNGLTQTIASSSIKLSWFNNDSGFLTSYDAWTHPYTLGYSATTSSLDIGTSTGNLSTLTLSSSTAPQLSLSSGGGQPLFTLRNSYGTFYLSTSSVAGTSTTTQAALTVSGTGFGTTTLLGLNITGQATSTSNVGYNITAGC